MPTATRLVQNEELGPQKRSSTSRHFEGELRQRVVGQNEAVQALVDLYRYSARACILLAAQWETYYL